MKSTVLSALLTILLIMSAISGCEDDQTLIASFRAQNYQPHSNAISLQSGDNDDRYFRVVFSNEREKLLPGQVGHRKIKQHYRGGMVVDFLHCIPAIGNSYCVGHSAESEHTGQTGDNRLFVVYDEYWK